MFFNKVERIIIREVSNKENFKEVFELLNPKELWLTKYSTCGFVFVLDPPQAERVNYTEEDEVN